MRNQIHTCTLTLSGHTSTQLLWRHCQIFTSASHHIASRVEQICGTQCVARRSVLTVSSWNERTCHALFVLMRNCAIRFNQDWNHLWKWLGLRSGLGECAFIVMRLNRIRSGSMCIGCPVWTGLYLPRQFFSVTSKTFPSRSPYLGVTRDESYKSIWSQLPHWGSYSSISGRPRGFTNPGPWSLELAYITWGIFAYNHIP